MNFLNIEFFGYLAAILTTVAFLPQLIKTLKTKKAEDVSLVTLIMFICGVGSWIIYGYKISSLPILIANIIKVTKETSSAFFVFNVLINCGRKAAVVKIAAMYPKNSIFKEFIIYISQIKTLRDLPF